MPTPTEPTDPPTEDNFLLVIQEYITNPHLIGGYKHDMRIYVLVTSFSPLTIHLYNDGLSRFCSEKFTLNDFSYLKHLTNTSIHHKLWRKGKLNQSEEKEFTHTIDNVIPYGDFTKRRLRSLLAYMRDSGVDIIEVWNRIQKTIILTLLPLLKEPPDPTLKCFELLGFDFLLTDKLDPILLEVNMGPSLEIECDTDMAVKFPLVTDIFSLISNEPTIPARFPSLSDRSRQSTGDFDQIFPFNRKSEELAEAISKGVRVPENIYLLVKETSAFYSLPLKDTTPLMSNPFGMNPPREIEL